MSKSNFRPEPHCITKARLLFGLELNVDDLKSMVRQIESKDSLLSAKLETNNLERHLLTYQGVQIPLIYDPDRKFIVTILPVCRNNYTPRRHKVKIMKRRRGRYRDDVFHNIPARLAVGLPPDE